MGWTRHPAVIRGSQILIGILFAWAALAKLGELERFAAQVHNYRLLPIALENLVALTIPWIELLAALALILGVRSRSGAIVVTTLLIVFTVGVAQAMARGLDFECGCFGTADGTRVGAFKVLQNLGMLAVALLAARQPR